MGKRKRTAIRMACSVRKGMKTEMDKSHCAVGRNIGYPEQSMEYPKKRPEIINLTSLLPSPSIPPLFPPTPPLSPLYNPYSPTTHPSPLLDFEDLVSNFNSVTSSSSSGNVGDIEF